MPIDIQRDKLLTLTQARDRLPKVRRGKKLSTSTLWRWARAGYKTRSGPVVLETVPVGRRLMTSMKAVAEFFERLADAKFGPAKEHRPTTPAARKKLYEKAMRDLAEMGVL